MSSSPPPEGPSPARHPGCCCHADCHGESPVQEKPPVLPFPAVLRDERLVVTIEEAAELLGVSRAHGYELAAQGVLPTIQLRRRRVVPKLALLKMVGLDDGGSS